MGSRRSSGCVYWLGEWVGLHLPESGLLFCQMQTAHTRSETPGMGPSVPTYVCVFASPSAECFPQLSFPTNRSCSDSSLKPPRPPPLASHPCALLDTDVHLKASSMPVHPSGLLSRVFKNRDHLTLLSAPGTRKGRMAGGWGVRSRNAG